MNFDTDNVTGYQLSKSYPLDSSTWYVEARGHTADQGPQRVRVYAIALYDPQDNFDVKIFSSDFEGAGQTQGSVSLILNSTYALAGGGASTDEFLVSNYPYQEFGVANWRASFITDPLRPGGVSTTGLKVYVIGIRAKNANYSVSGEPIGNVQMTSTQQIFSSQSSSLPGYLEMVGGGFIASNATIQGSYPLSPINNDGLFIWSAKAVNLGLKNPSLVVFGLGLGISSSDTNNPNNIQAPTSTCSASLTQSLVSSWPVGVQIEVVITNTGTEDLVNVGFYASQPSLITLIWAVHETSYIYNGFYNNVYTLPTTLGILPVGASFQFGFLATNVTELSIVYTNC
eukprot:TRINITY_DN2178_c0_g2_i9.p1 TRINITY_DN2178_c0_g2~~TRINITY_DN2178_c0_g2_i9.p1  ORF type:complete len:342 (-),score=61.65 TRINITY_DN2178_c0_g2_i9:132-1157(-)